MKQPTLFINPPTIARDEFEKEAGSRLSSDARMWEEQLTQRVAADFPFLPMEDMTVHFDEVDPAKGTAVGAVAFSESGVNLPFIIRREKTSGGPELFPLDVFEHEGVLKPATATAVKQAVLSRGIGTPLGALPNAAIRGTNPYIGDMTGDVSPLEFGGSGAAFNSGGAGIKTGSLKNVGRGAVIGGITGAGFQATRELENAERRAESEKRPFTNKDRVRALKRALVRGGSVGAAVGAASTGARSLMGVQDTFSLKQASKTIGVAAFLAKIAARLHPNELENFRRVTINNPMIMQTSNLDSMQLILKAKGRDTLVESKTKSPNVMIVMKDPITEEITVKFPGTPKQVVHGKEELKAILGDQLQTAMAQLNATGMYVATENIEQRSWQVNNRRGSELTEAEHDGLYTVQLLGGRTVPAYVVKSIVRPSGQVYKGKMIVTIDGEYGFSPSVFGVRIGSGSRLPASEPKRGRTGCFVNYAAGTPIVTTPLEIQSATTLTANETSRATALIVCKDMVTGEVISLIPSRAVSGFVKVKDINSANPVLAMAKGDVYYMPENAQWVELKTPVRLPQQAEDLEKVGHVVEGGVLVRRDQAGQWEIGIHGGDSLHGLEDHDAFELLVGMGVTKVADLVAISEQAQSEIGLLLTGLGAPQAHGEIDVAEKVAEVDEFNGRFADAERWAAEHCRMNVDHLKIAADVGDKDTIDAMLSLNFLTPDNMRTFVEHTDEFELVGQKLAKLLVATRLGLPNVRERSVKEAMEGIARTCDQLKLLKSAYGHQREQAHGSM